MSKLMFSAAPHVDQMILPIKKIGVNFFSFTRVFDDGAVIDFNNRPDMAYEFYYGDDKFYEDYTPERKPFNLDSSISFLNNVSNNRTINFLRDKCRIDNMCAIVEKGIGYIDVYNFGTNPNDSLSQDVYIHNMDFIKSFSFFAKEKLAEDIKKFSAQPIEVCRELVKNPDCGFKKDLALDIKKYHIGMGCKYLTKKQFYYCSLLKKGKSPEEIAIIMGLSTGNSRNYINKIKKVFDVEHIYQLMSTLHGMATI